MSAMNPRQTSRRALWRRTWMAAWGMATLVLGFAVIMLTVVLIQRTPQPESQAADTDAAAAQSSDGKPVTTPALIERPDALPTVSVPLYFADPAGRGLVAEAAAVEHGDFTVENCRKALEALAKGPQGALAPVLPPTMRVRGLYLLEDGHLVVDFAIELELDLRRFKSAGFESVMAYAIANTLTQPELQGGKEPAVTKVSLLIEGAPPRDSFPAHLDMSQPILPNPEWVVKTQEQ